MTTYGFVRSTHDSEGNWKFAGEVFVAPGIVHMLDDVPATLPEILSHVQKYNSEWPDSPFDIATVPRQLVAGLEVGAITMKEIK